MAYGPWTRDEISFILIDEVTESSVVTIEVNTPQGSLLIMGEPREERRTLIIERMHVSSNGIKPNDVGIRNLRQIAAVMMEELDL